MKITKNKYLEGFGIAVFVLALVRCIFPSVAETKRNDSTVKVDTVVKQDTVEMAMNSTKTTSDTTNVEKSSIFVDSDGKLVKHKILSVPNFGKAFPDFNDVQLESAVKYGVKPVKDRAEAERRKKELVFVGSNPYFYVDRLHSSIPYLVPRASVLLQEIGRNFFDSLQIKGIPLHKIIITSVMRSKDDVQRLRGHNGNATQNSCHLYGTTFDVCYNRYKTIEDPDGPARRKVRNDTLKWVLSEVLNDMRTHGKCYIKYEVNQGCFHITAK